MATQQTFQIPPLVLDVDVRLELSPELLNQLAGDDQAAGDGRNTVGAVLTAASVAAANAVLQPLVDAGYDPAQLAGLKVDAGTAATGGYGYTVDALSPPAE